MRKNTFTILFALGLLLVTVASVQAQDDHFAALRPFVGKTWKGEFSNSTPDNPLFDIAQWEWALSGKAVRIRHSVNDGAYGGETFVVWDEPHHHLVYYYFTTAGFYTTGTMTFEDGKYVAHEKVTGSADGITEVKATGELLPDGRMRTSSTYLQNGQWVEGHQITYTEDANSKVVYK